MSCPTARFLLLTFSSPFLLVCLFFSRFFSASFDLCALLSQFRLLLFGLFLLCSCGVSLPFSSSSPYFFLLFLPFPAPVPLVVPLVFDSSALGHQSRKHQDSTKRCNWTSSQMTLFHLRKSLELKFEKSCAVFGNFQLIHFPGRP